MLIEISAEDAARVTAQELMDMIDNKGISKKELKAARIALTYFTTYEYWVGLPKRYTKGVSWLE